VFVKGFKNEWPTTTNSLRGAFSSYDFEKLYYSAIQVWGPLVLPGRCHVWGRRGGMLGHSFSDVLVDYSSGGFNVVGVLAGLSLVQPCFWTFGHRGLLGLRWSLI
jgi:hypothetical protein